MRTETHRLLVEPDGYPGRRTAAAQAVVEGDDLGNRQRPGGEGDRGRTHVGARRHTGLAQPKGAGPEGPLKHLQGCHAVPGRGVLGPGLYRDHEGRGEGLAVELSALYGSGEKLAQAVQGRAGRRDPPRPVQ